MNSSGDVFYLNQMLSCIETVHHYLEGVDEDVFAENKMIQDACLLRLIIIGESAGKVSGETKLLSPQIEWNDMKLARNFYVHVYDSIVWSRVWDTICALLHPLEVKLRTLIMELNKEN